MDTHSSHMNLELEGAEREREAKAIADQHKADLEHLLKNVHPSLRDVATIGDASNGACQSLSDYASQILESKIETLKEEMSQLKTDFETLRSQVLADWTPETPLETEAPAPTPAPASTQEPAPIAPAPEEAPKV